LGRMMAKCLPLLLLSMLLWVSVRAQGEEEGSGEDNSECEDCEEAWEYVEFLKTEVAEKVEDILQKTLYEAKERSGTLVLEETVTKSMDQVMEIRESLLGRIKAIRKEEGITICPEQNIKQEEKLSELRMEVMGILLKLVEDTAASVEGLKDIGTSLLQFKMTVTDEVMRLLMLPQPKCDGGPKPKTDGPCSECADIEEISTKIENLIECAQKKEDEGADEGAEETEQAEEEVTEGECMPPAMYAMELIGVNENIDAKIKDLYTKIIAAETEEDRNESLQTLTAYKGIRDSIDDVITKLMDEKDEAKLKKIIPRSLRGVSSEVKKLLVECKQKYCGGGACESCAAEVLTDAIARMESYRGYFETAKENPGDAETEESTKDSIRTDMIKFINDINEQSRGIITEKVETGEIDDCQQEKLDIYTQIKAPLWMLVNTTIFAPSLDVLEEMVVVMTNQMDELLNSYCSEEPIKRIAPEGPNCEWEEYEETKKYLTKVDEIIQDALFKAKDDGAQMTALLGFVEVQTMLDKRVKILFENSLACPEEVNFIKKEYMPQLNKCMGEFMNGKLKFKEMNRIQRISCTKVMRNKMEDRMSELLSFELDKSLNEIQGAGGDVEQQQEA